MESVNDYSEFSIFGAAFDQESLDYHQHQTQHQAQHYSQHLNHFSEQNPPPGLNKSNHMDKSIDQEVETTFEILEESPAFGVVNDAELSSLNIKDLNRKLKEKGLTKETIEKLKQRRRTLKNRKYATDCREKKDSEVQTLEHEKEMEADSLDRLERNNDDLREKLNKLKSHYLKVLEFAKKNNIELKPRTIPGLANPDPVDHSTTMSDASTSL